MVRRRCRGVTLVELVISITVIGVAVAGVLSVMSLRTAHSVDPLLQVQAVAIADAYLEEILLLDFADPDGAEAGENRATYDDVDDYHALAANGCLTTSAGCPGLGDCACDQSGAPLPGLAGYQVGVTVNTEALHTAAGAKRVDVTVTHVDFPDASVRLSGYRSAY